MATKTTTRTPSAAKTPEALALDAAAETLGAAHAARDAAEAHRDDLTQRLTDGDASISATDLLTADADVTRTAALLAHALKVHTAADAANRVAVAVATARTVAATAAATLDGTTTSLGKATHEAAATIREALGTLRAQVATQNEVVGRAASQAAAAGLVVGEADPMSPVLVRTCYGAVVALVVDGVEVSIATDADELVTQVITEATA